MTANTLLELAAEDDAIEKSQQVIRNVQHKPHIITLTCQAGTYNNEERLNATVIQVEPVDYVIESNKLFEQILEMTAGTNNSPR